MEVPWFADILEVGDALAAAGFAEPAMDAERITLEYSSLDSLLGELDSTGTGLLVKDGEKWRSRKDDLAAAWQPAGDLLLTVYPLGLLHELRSYAESHAIVVDDPGGLLTPVLAAHEIAYVDIGHVPGERGGLGGGRDTTRCPPRLALLVSSRKGNDERARRSSDNVGTLLSKGFRVVRFLEHVETLPHIRIQEAGGSKCLDVEMRLLDSLMDDPRDGRKKETLEVEA